MSAPKKILLVEDNDDDAFLFCRAYRGIEAGCLIDVVSDGQKAKEYLANCRDAVKPALVLLDLQLPFFTGFDLLQWIREDEKLRRLPVVVLTSSAQPRDIDRAYALNANSYLVKPTDVRQLKRLAQGIQLFWIELNQGAPSAA